MTNRRDIVRGGVVLAAGAFALRRLRAESAPIAAAPAANVLAIADLYLDTASAEFVTEVWRQGFDTQGFDADVGHLWLHTIEPALRAGDAKIVGLTGAGVLFCLETMARSYGFGTKFRAERPQGGGAGWTRVATRHTLAAAAAGDAPTLAPFEHATNPTATSPRLFAWTIARHARRTA